MSPAVIDPPFEDQLEDILEVMCALARGELEARVPSHAAGPNASSAARSLEGVRLALNMLGEELQASVVSKARYELLFNELEVTQSQLMHAAKLASLGQLAAGIAHELNQPLQIIGFAVEELRDALADDNPQAAAQCIEQVEAQVERGAGVVGRLLAFSRHDEGQLEPADLNEMVSLALGVLRNPLVAGGIEVVMELSDAVLPIACCQSELIQAITNLVLNARDAVHQRERARISVKTFAQDHQVCVEVADNGEGIAEANLPRIFDPFFTTKSVGKGTGLGLSITRGITHRHGGNIEVISKLGEGARLRITLPISENPPS